MKLKISKFLDTVIEYSLYGLIFFIPISIAAIGTFGAIAILLFLIKQILSPDFSSIKAHKTFFSILLIFFIFMALSLLNSGPLLNKSLIALCIKWGRFPVLLWIIIDTLRDSRRIVNALWVFAASSTLLALTCFSQKFLGCEFIFHHPLNKGGIVTGSFKNQNDLAAYLTGVIPIILSLGLWKWQKPSIRISLFLLTAVLMTLSILTVCRGGWAGLATGFISITLLINYTRLPKKIFWFLFLASYIVCLPAIGFSFLLFDSRGDSARLMIYHGAWKMIVEHPLLGKGLGTFMDYCADYINKIGTYYVHNCFLQIWAESGIFSMFSFITLLGYIFIKNIKIIIKTPVSLDFFILIGLNAGLLGFSVHSLFDTQLYSLQLSFLFWVILGLTLAHYSNLKQGQTV